MIKIGTSNGNVILSVSSSEFKKLTGKTPSNVPDNTEVPAIEAFKKIELVDSKFTLLKSVAINGQKLIDDLKAAGVLNA